MVPAFPVHHDRQPYYPIVAGYCFTMHKVMGQTLPHVTLVFDSQFLSPAVGYVALSRVSSLDNVVPMLRLRKTHFINCYQIYVQTFQILPNNICKLSFTNSSNYYIKYRTIYDIYTPRLLLYIFYLLTINQMLFQHLLLHICKTFASYFWLLQCLHKT